MLKWLLLLYNVHCLVNLKVNRFLDLTGQQVREKTTVQLEDPESSYLVGISSKFHPYLSFITCHDGPSKQQLEVTKDRLEGDVQYYLVQSQKKQDLHFVFGYNSHLLKLLPRQVEQPSLTNAKDSTKQFLLLTGWNAYFTSPYKTKQQQLSVRFPAQIKRHSSVDPTSKSGSSLVYGPYHDIPAKSYGPIEFHYEYPTGILVAKNLKRSIQISHLTNTIYVEDLWEMENQGAKLKGHFSRIDYMQTSRMQVKSNMIESLQIKLPPKAYEVYFKDQNGNVSTTHFRSNNVASLLEFRPRYPLCGGWNYTFFYGYKVPLNDYVSSSKGYYEYQGPLFNTFANATIDQMTLELKAPEGSKNLKLKMPLQANSKKYSTFYSYFDTIGKPMLTVTFTNLMDESAVPIQFSYDYPWFMIMWKPFVVTLACILVVSIASFSQMVDISLQKEKTPVLTKLELSDFMRRKSQSKQDIKELLTVLERHEKFKVDELIALLKEKLEKDKKGLDQKIKEWIDKFE